MKRLKKSFIKFLLIASVSFYTLAIVVCGQPFLFKKPIFVFKYSALVIISSSMEPQYPVNSITIIKKEPISSLKVGDVIAYKSNAVNGQLALHRIVRFTENGFYTQGDKNNYEDNQLITAQSYVGKAVSKITFTASYLAKVKTPLGKIMLIVIPIMAGMLLLFALRLFR